MNQQRKTKIIATLGPATDPYQVLTNLVNANFDIARINMSYANRGVNATRIENLRSVAKIHKKSIKIFVDLPGSKVRIGKFIKKSVNLKLNQPFILDPDLDPIAGTEQAVSVLYQDLFKDLNYEDLLLLDDGKIILQVTQVKGKKIFCTVKQGGILTDHQGINLLGGGLTLGEIPLKDQEEILFASQLHVDYFGLSFIRSAEDVLKYKEIIKYAKSNAKVFAKIATQSAIVNIKQILEVADGIVIARGDLGVELGINKLPQYQQELLRIANRSNKPAIVATEIMDSMIDNIYPTKAEIMDLAYAISSGADGVMFTKETAIGNHPDLVIQYANEICESAEDFHFGI